MQRIVLDADRGRPRWHELQPVYRGAAGGDGQGLTIEQLELDTHAVWVRNQCTNDASQSVLGAMSIGSRRDLQRTAATPARAGDDGADPLAPHEQHLADEQVVRVLDGVDAEVQRIRDLALRG